MRFYLQHDSIDCGPACLKMIARHYRKDYSLQYLRDICNINRQGTSVFSLGRAAEKIGFKTVSAEVSLTYLKEKGYLPCILFWDNNHFVVLYKIKKDKNVFYVADPSVGRIRLTPENIIEYWGNGGEQGFVLFLEPSADFYRKQETVKANVKASPLKFLSEYFHRFKKNYVQIFFTFCATTLASFLFPFLTQAIVDTGVHLRDLSFVVLILAFQLYLFITSTVADVLRSHLLLHISSRINISILNDFLVRMMKLPMKFFESKMTGDLVQRIQDHAVIEQFITSTILTFIFTIVNIVVYLSILYYYDSVIFTVFMVASALFIGWTLFFLRWRKSLNYMRFSEMASASEKIFETASQMPEIKINRLEEYKKKEWENMRIRLFKLELSKLSLEQYQRLGSDFFEQIRTILIIFLSVYSVINGSLTLGMMLAISYVIGQLNMPIKEVTKFITTYQTAAIGLERMNEVYVAKSEDEEYGKSNHRNGLASPDDCFRGIELNQVSFAYHEDDKTVLQEVTLKIPTGKITAIVGASGSGKTTLLKLLLRFYEPTSGKILLNGNDFQEYPIDWWRSQIGVVMQEGHIFSDTIFQNIVMGDNSVDNKKLVKAVETANMEDFILDLPMNFETKVGAEGIGLSSGQKQRILIARAIYKEPAFLFFDEATSSLDATNEREIMEKMETLFQGKTVIIIAHRLSTVKTADQIAVLEKGRIVEIGTHQQLVEEKGFYFDLVKNQLELEQ